MVMSPLSSAAYTCALMPPGTSAAAQHAIVTQRRSRVLRREYNACRA